jgi:hypothetical protein
MARESRENVIDISKERKDIILLYGGDCSYNEIVERLIEPFILKLGIYQDLHDYYFSKGIREGETSIDGFVIRVPDDSCITFEEFSEEVMAKVKRLEDYVYFVDSLPPVSPRVV